MKILVTFALENEFAPWRELRKFAPGKLGDLSVFGASAGEAELTVLLTGVGRKQASLAISDAIRRSSEHYLACISAGLAGALRHEYAVGEVLAARGILSDDQTQAEVTCSEDLLSLAKTRGATVVEKFYTSSGVVASAESKKALGARADAVEMESFEIVAACQVSGVPSIAIRSISDEAGEDLPLDMSLVFSDEGQVSLPRVLGQVARHPASIPGLVRLGRNSKKAAESLARFLDSYIGELAANSVPLETRTSKSAY
jgi:adenosylhomocysteine nucleosidase